MSHPVDTGRSECYKLPMLPHKDVGIGQKMAAVDAGWVFVPYSHDSSIKSKTKRKRIAGRVRMSEEGEQETFKGIRAPIVGYEVVERREKFTVYKVHVHDGKKSWFVFRRYTDFVRLNDELQNAFPGFHFKLPAKRWFKNNFDSDFIEERAHGLQFFINNIMQHTTISRSDIVKQFLCLDDPPGPYDSLEESRAYCQQLEDEIANMKETFHDLVSELSATKSQLAQARVQQDSLVSALKEERATNSCRKNMKQDTNTDSFKPIMADHMAVLNRKHSSDSRKSENIVEAESISSNTWAGSLEISAHSKGVDKIKPASKSSETIQPFTSTPTKLDSHFESFKDDNISREVNGEQAVGCHKSALDSTVKDIGASSSSNHSDKEVKSDDASDNNKASEHSNKRDSGIILDSPSTT